MIRFDNLPPEVIQAMCTPMHIILPSQSIPASGASTATTTGALYLGSMAAVTEPALLRSHHISVLVQVVDAAWLPMSEKEGFICHRMNIDDAPSFDLKPFLEGACRSIDDALRCGRSVLVHCHQGVSRSAAIVIAYLIRNRGMSFDNAYAYVKRHRACVKPNAGFVQCLQEWEGRWLAKPSLARSFTSVPSGGEGADGRPEYRRNVTNG